MKRYPICAGRVVAIKELVPGLRPSLVPPAVFDEIRPGEPERTRINSNRQTPRLDVSTFTPGPMVEESVTRFR